MYGLQMFPRSLDHFIQRKNIFITFVYIKWCSLVTQKMDIVDMAIHRVVCQKSNFHANGDIQNSQKLDPL
jgi:hypothetical protein